MQTLEEIKSIVTLKAKENDLDPRLLHALVMTESGYNPWATRYELDYRWLYKVEEMARILRVEPITVNNPLPKGRGFCKKESYNYERVRERYRAWHIALSFGYS